MSDVRKRLKAANWSFVSAGLVGASIVCQLMVLTDLASYSWQTSEMSLYLLLLAIWTRMVAYKGPA